MNATSKLESDEELAPPLVRRLASDFQATWVDKDSVEPWAREQSAAAILLAGDPRRFPEGQDVAVVLPELQKSFAGRFQIAVVAQRDEDGVAALYGVLRWPSVVFLREGHYVTTLTGMLDWDVYLAEMAKAFEMPVSRPPTVGIPVVSQPTVQSSENS